MAAEASAAILTGTVIENAPGTGTTLDAGTVLNWAAWNNTSSTQTLSAAATNSLSGGPTVSQPGFISAITSAGVVTSGTPVGHNVRGAGGTAYQYAWTGRTSGTIGYILDGNLAEVGEGVKFTVTGGTTLPADQFYRVNVWATGFRAIGELTATLNGATTIDLLSRSFTDAKEATLFQIDFRPDNASDLLQISYVLDEAVGGLGSYHVGIQAVSVEIIPEPSAALLAAAGGLIMFRRRRR